MTNRVVVGKGIVLPLSGQMFVIPDLIRDDEGVVGKKLPIVKQQARKTPSIIKNPKNIHLHTQRDAWHEKVIISGMISNGLEWYDFALYAFYGAYH